MHEILRRLPPEARVLDLGCARGSFRAGDTQAAVVRCDLDPRAGGGHDRFVCADARHLPFAPRTFDAAILHHSLEHFPDPANVLAEVGRLIRPGGYLWVAVPDASTVTDRLYRWLGRGGGHVNRFCDAGALAAMVERQTGLAHIGTRLLYTSLSFVNRRNIPGRPPRRLYLVGGGAEWTVRWATFLMRMLDRLLGTRLSIYGWACCFGPPLDFDTQAWSNVCVRCGSGSDASRLLAAGAARRTWFGIRRYRCPVCDAANYFSCDFPDRG